MNVRRRRIAQYNERALERTHAWAERCLQAKSRPDQALFGIVQGGIFSDLREASARFISSLGFPGHAIGGLSVGETKAEMHAVLDVVDLALPDDKPRYLMGVGTPQDLVNGVLRGVDIFDCVLAHAACASQCSDDPNGSPEPGECCFRCAIRFPSIQTAPVIPAASSAGHTSDI